MYCFIFKLGNNSEIMDEKDLKDKIPNSTYKELVGLFGRKQADKMVKDSKSDFRSLSMLILAEKFKLKYRINFWVVCALIIILYLIFSYYNV